MRKQLMGIVFADVVGFGSFTEGEVARFSTTILPECITVATSAGAVYSNTWGDAIVAFFESVGAALDYALAIRDIFRNRDWDAQSDYTFRAPLSVRIALHAADVFVSDRSDVPGGKLFGTQVSLAARIEPIGVPNEVFASEAAVSTLRAQRPRHVQFQSLGRIVLPKEQRQERIYRIRRQGESTTIQQRSPIHWSTECLPSTEAAYGEIVSASERVSSIRILSLNGGSSLHGLLEAMRGRIASGCRLKMLVFDADCSRLEPQLLSDGSGRRHVEALRKEIARDPAIAKAASEYLMQASELGAWTNEPQSNQVERVTERLSNFAQSLKRTRLELVLRQTPRWGPGRMWLLDDVGFFTPYFQPYKLAPVLVVRQGSDLFESMASHFEYVWDESARDERSLVFQLP